MTLSSLLYAGLAQLVEHLICNQAVVGSNPTAGSTSHKGLWVIVRFSKNLVSRYSHTLRVDPLCNEFATVCTDPEISMPLKKSEARTLVVCWASLCEGYPAVPTARYYQRQPEASAEGEWRGPPEFKTSV